MRIAAANIFAVPTPQYELAPTTRFSDRAGDYALYRPSYPKAAIDHALEGLRRDENALAVDVGAGTGISSRLIADRGVKVIAVEPNASMREGAEPHPRVVFREGSAEATGLDQASADLVVVAQAFHWFRPEQALAEFRRVLKPKGRLVIFVNERDETSGAMRAYNTAIKVAVDRELSEGMRTSVEDALAGIGKNDPPARFANEQRLPLEGLIGRARSASYVPKEGPRFEQLMKDLEALWTEHRDANGVVALTYVTLVWRVSFD